MGKPERNIPQSCILFATADWDEPYWTNKQHCAKSLAELGTKVLYVESVGLRSPNINSTKDWNRLWNRLRKGLSSLVFGARQRLPGVFVLSPLLVPAGYRYPVTRTLNRLLMKAALARAAWKQQFLKPLIWTYHPFMLDMIEGMKTGPLLYHCVDDIAAVPGVDAKVFREVERVLLQRADVVFVTAPSLAEYCLKFNPNTHFLSNVVDVDHFGQALKSGPIPEDLACIPEPRLCYHGVLSDYKIDFQLLLDAARIKPEFSWIFIGDEREGQKNSFVSELKLLPNVYFLGYKPYTMLPDYLRGMQVGLLPSLINDYTRGMFPMKYYEYLAAGLPVTSTPLDFTTVEHSGIEIGFDVKSFVVAINLQLSRGRLSKNRVSGFVGNNTWKTRTLRMLNKIKWVCCCVVF